MNGHPQAGSGQIFQRQCRLQALESQRTGNWEVKCDRSTPPFFILEEPTVHMYLVNNLDCKTCCEVMTDPELNDLQAVCDEISERRDKKKDDHKRFIEKLVKDPYLRDVKTEAEKLQRNKDCDEWEKQQHNLEAEIQSLTDELGKAEKDWNNRKLEVEEPDFDDFIDLALVDQDRYDELYQLEGFLFYFGTVTQKEAMEHPYHFPKVFPPGHMLRWCRELQENPLEIMSPLSSTMAYHDPRFR